MAYDRALKAALSATCLFLVCGTGAAWAYGAGGTAHPSVSPPASARTHAPPMAPRASSEHQATTTTIPAPITPAPSSAAGCETDVAANCEARAESRFTATGGDPAPSWTAPTPTSIPPTPTAPAISEPQTTTDTSPLTLEQSGGSSRPAIEGGGPTLTDCMALWDPAVHMTKALWHTVCVRTLNGIDLPSAGLGLPEPGQTRNQVQHHRQTTHEARN